MNAGATIAAVASPPGGGARAVLRVSGPRAADLVRGAFVADGAPGDARDGEGFTPSARGITLGRFDDGRGTQPAMLVWMPGPGSYTREDVAEFHLVGSPPLVAAALERLLRLGAQPAEPGEFTRRAFLSGRLDLTRAEGVLSLVTARSEAERRAASQLLAGGLADRIDALRAGLDALRALCEASLDFDETDTGHVPEDELRARTDAVLEGLREALAWESARAPRSGLPQVVLVGAPNAGKSRLYNRLAGADALVSGRVGTTRDALRTTWRAGDAEVELWDTAGAVAPDGAVEREAQDRARALREAADLALWVVDARRPADDLVAEREALAAGGARYLVWNQVDRPGAAPAPPAALTERLAGAAAVSAATGAGLDELAAGVAAALGLAAAPATAAAPAAAAAPATAAALGRPEALGGGGEARELSARHREALRAAAARVEAAAGELAAGAPLDLVAEGLREATARLDAIGGRTTPEDLLDRIFGQFCIGK